MGAKLFDADRRTDMTKLIVVFRNFAKARRNISHPLLRTPLNMTQYFRDVVECLKCIWGVCGFICIAFYYRMVLCA